MPACTTVLSRYNPSPWCSVHERAATLGESALATGTGPLTGVEHGTVVLWSAGLFPAGTRAARGLCTKSRCLATAEFAWFEGKSRARVGWKALCTQHTPGEPAVLAAVRAGAPAQHRGAA